MFKKLISSGDKDAPPPTSTTPSTPTVSEQEMQRMTAELFDRNEEVKVLKVQIKYLKEQNQELLNKVDSNNATQSLSVEVVHKPKKSTYLIYITPKIRQLPIISPK